MTGTPTTRVAGADDRQAIGALLASAFLDAADDGAALLDPLVFQPDRSLVAVDGNRIVGHVSSYGRRLAVPAATLPAAHVALVAVAPTYRRQGLLSELIHRQLAGLRDAGQEAIAVLWASEGRIYHRYGFGLASTRLNVTGDLTELGRIARPHRSGGRLHDLFAADGRAAARSVYSRVWPTRPGWSERTDEWWEHLTADPPNRRYGATALRILLAEGADGVDGYAMWRAGGHWSATGPAGSMEVREVVADSADALRELWRFLLSLDLTRTVNYPLAAADDPLLHLVPEPRKLSGLVADALWIRVLDIAAALERRRYRVPVDLVLAVSDELLPENAARWRVCGDDSGAACAPTVADPDLALDVRELGAVYLGGTSFTTLAAAGRVTECRPGALAAADAAFGWHRAPSAVEMF